MPTTKIMKEVAEKLLGKPKMKKEAQTEKPKQKVCYDVKMEVMSPITVHFRVWAFDPKEAVEAVKKGRVLPSFISKPIIHNDRIRSLAVYLAGTINKVFSFDKR